jgi:act minimal PKS acyl carrier protein
MTVDDLLTVLRQCAGVDESITLDESAMDTGFDDLGYDSLAVLEITGHIQREFGVRLADDAVKPADSPRRLLELVNAE